jgi:hypothetical protein
MVEQGGMKPETIFGVLAAALVLVTIVVLGWAALEVIGRWA